MGILFTILIGFLFTTTMGFLFTIVLGIQFTISTGITEKGLEAAGVVPVRDKKGDLKALTLKLSSFGEVLSKPPRNPAELPEKTKEILSQDNRRKKK